LACIYFSINDFGIDGILLSTIFGNLIVMIFMISVFREFKFSITLDVIKPLVIAGIPMLFFNLLVTLMIGIDRIAVASVMNTSTNALGIYHFGYLFSMGIFTAFNAVAFLFIPKFFKQYHNEVEDRDDVELIIKQTSLTEIIVTLLSVVGIFAVPLFITLFLPEYIASIKVTQLLLFSYIINATAFFASTHLLANDMQMRIMPLIMIVVFFSYFLNLYVLDLGLGLYGVALASSLAFGTYGLGVFCLYLQSEKKPLLTNIIRVYWRLALFFLVSVFVIWEDLPLYYLLVLFIIIYGLKIRYFWINYSNLLFDNLKIR
jgi:O-antigen/teichoic acid export membrane protein